MAEAKIPVSPDQFICCVCQERLKDPVTITCGHNYCKQCIEDYWDTNEIFKCPQCRTTFVLRPVLHRNTVLAEVVEELNKTNPVDVLCDVCTGTKARAVKTCLTCQASFCETHIEPHRVSEVLRKHKLEVPLPNLNEKLCSKHQNALDVYCRTDQTCICCLCAVTEHRSHDTVTPDTERQERQAQVLTSRRDVKEKIKNKRKTLEEVTVMEAQVKSTAEKEVQEYQETFDLLLQSIGGLRSEVISMIKEHEKIEMTKVVEVRDQLEKEIWKLERKDTELEVISQTGDDICFLQNVRSLCIPSVCESTPIIAVKEHLLSETLRRNLLKLNESLKKINCSEFVKTSETGKESDHTKEITQQNSQVPPWSASTSESELTSGGQNIRIGRISKDPQVHTSEEDNQKVNMENEHNDDEDGHFQTFPGTDIKEPDKMSSSSIEEHIEKLIQDTEGFKDSLKNQIETTKSEISDLLTEPKTQHMLLSSQGEVEKLTDFFLTFLKKHLVDVKELQTKRKDELHVHLMSCVPEVKKKESKGPAFLNWFSRSYWPSYKALVIEVVGSVKTAITQEMFFYELSKKLKNHNITIKVAQLDNESRNLVLLFCPVVSKIGTDIALALKKVSGNKKIILVVMHHTPNPEYVVADSSRLVDQENVVLTVDYLFHETIGLLNCNLNNKSSQKLFNFICSFM